MSTSSQTPTIIMYDNNTDSTIEYDNNNTAHPTYAQYDNNFTLAPWMPPTTNNTFPEFPHTFPEIPPNFHHNDPSFDNSISSNNGNSFDEFQLVLYFMLFILIGFILFIGNVIKRQQASNDILQTARPDVITPHTTTQGPRPMEGAVNRNEINNSDNPSLRMRILSIVVPRQRIQKEQMVYDSEDQSYRFKGGDVGSGSTTTSCGICLEYFREGDVIMMGQCQHPYHRKCCLEWVAKQNSCPLCRTNMFDETAYNVVKAETAGVC